MKLNGMDLIPAPWATTTETRRVRGGYMGRWSVLAEVQVPAVRYDPENARIFAHPSLIAGLIASAEGKRVYLLGPPNVDDPLYRAEAERLRGLGHCVVSPAEVDGPVPAVCRTRRMLAQMLACDTVALLPGWTKSKLDRWMAADLGLTVVYARELVA